MIAREEAVEAAVEALALIPGTTVAYPRSVAATVLAAVEPILLAAERQRIAEAIREVADSDGQWIGPADPDSVIRMVARRVAEADL